MTSRNIRSVWIVNHYATDPDESASGSRHFSLARGLVEEGWSPIIFAASTEHPSGQQRKGVLRRRINERVRKGVTFRFLWTPAYGGGAGRVLNILTFARNVLSASTVRDLDRPTVVIGSTVHPPAAWAASVLAKRLNVPFVFEIRDLWPQTLIDMGKLNERGLVAWALRRLEKNLCDRADAVITLLPYAHEYLIARGVSQEKIFWVSNGTDVGDFSPISEPKKNDSFTFMYLGSVGRANGVSAIVEGFIAAASSDSHIRLVIVGDGTERRALEKRLEESDVRDRVVFREPVPKNVVPSVIASADGLVINVLDLDVYRYGVSMNKLFDYAASSLPILIASNARNNIVAEADAGISVSSNDAVALGAAMLEMASTDRKQRIKWGENGRRYVEKRFDYRVLARQLDEILEQTVAGNKSNRT